MARKAYGVEQIIVKLREIELLCNHGLPPVFALVDELVKTDHRHRHSFLALATS